MTTRHPDADNAVAETAQRITELYFASWLARDMATYRKILADDVTFKGPLAETDTAEDAVQGFERLAAMTTDIEIRHRWIDGPEVLTWFDLHLEDAPPIPVANWTRVEDGLITRIRVVFDPRPIAPPGS